MILFKKAADLRNWLDLQEKQPAEIGFVPTMGALHAGHISLIEASKKQDAITVCSIFINPTQFNDPKDFEKYPVTIEKDIYLLESAGCNVLFLPSVLELYPDGLEVVHKKIYDLGYMETILEGKFRPGHFQGVCQVVHRLLNIVQPGKLYLGQKDYQQCKIIDRLITLTEQDTSMKICPTLRENDGLAMSSRNTRLDDALREKAVEIFKTLTGLKQKIKPGNLEQLKADAAKQLQTEGFMVDYVEIVNAESLKPVSIWDGKEKLVSLIAAFLGEVRLIDNLELN